MIRGSKFLAVALIVAFIASAFFVPFHFLSQGSSTAPGSVISSNGPVTGFKNLSPVPSGASASVTFNESGLPTGSSWSVNVGGQQYSTVNSSIIISLPSGSYTYKISNSLGYFTENPTGNLTLAGNGQVVTTTFLGKFSINNFLNLETGKLVGSSSSLSTGQSFFPLYGIFDNYSHLLLVAGYSSSIIYEISPVNYTVMGQIDVSGSPLAIAVNPSSGLIYVINDSALLKYSPSGTLLGSIAFSSMPAALSFDPANGQVLVAVSNGGVVALNGSTLVHVADLPAISDFGTQGFAYNSALGQMEMIDNSGTNGYVAFMGSNDAILNTIQVPGILLALVYAPSLNVSVVTSISGASPYAYIISGSHVTKVSGSANAFGLGIDSSTGIGIATNSQNSTVMLMNLTTGSVVYTVNTGGSPLMPITVPGSSGMLIIDPNYDALDIIPLEYSVRSVQFIESGISPIIPWGISVNGYALNTRSNSLVFYEPMGNYSFSPTPVTGYSTQQSGTFAVSSGNIAVEVQYNKTYNVQFQESGLKSGMNWGVTFNGTTMYTAAGPELSFLAVNGTYNFSVPGGTGYAVSPQNGIIKVSGSDLSVSLNFSMKGYTVDFISTGMPSSSNWHITINGVGHLVQGNNFSYGATPGNYNYSIQSITGYYPQIASSSFSVSNQNITINLIWLPYLYNVNFTENMLPSGTPWSVNISNGLSLHSSSSNVSAYLQNGSYQYTFTSLNSSWKGFHGTLNVQGTATTVPVNFTEVLFLATFSEKGLPTGTDWTVTVNSQTHGSLYNNLTFSLPNGTYAYSAIAGNNSFSGVEGVLHVNGSSFTQKVDFALKESNVTFHETGLPSGALWGVYIAENGYFNTTQVNMTLTLPYGSYTFIPLSVQGFNSTNLSSAFSIGPSAGNYTINVTYSPIPKIQNLYNITVMEVGLPEGLEWAAAYNGTIVPAYPGGTFNFNLANGSYNLTFMAISHKGKEMPGSMTVPIQVNGTSQDLLVLFYGPYVWMIFDFPLIGGGHSDHNGHQSHQDNNHHTKDNLAVATRFKL